METMKNEAKYSVLIKTELGELEPKWELHIVEIRPENRLKQYYMLLDCRVIDIVSAAETESALPYDIDLIVDDEGLLKEQPVLNPVASMLCNRNLFGSALIMRYDEASEDIQAFSLEELKPLWEYLCKSINIINNILDTDISIAFEEYSALEQCHGVKDEA